jgi:hypothetical protein
MYINEKYYPVLSTGTCTFHLCFREGSELHLSTISWDQLTKISAAAREEQMTETAGSHIARDTRAKSADLDSRGAVGSTQQNLCFELELLTDCVEPDY